MHTELGDGRSCDGVSAAMALLTCLAYIRQIYYPAGAFGSVRCRHRLQGG